MIHPTAIIEKGAVLDESAEVGPYAVIEKGVSLDRGVVVSARAHIKGHTTIGENTFIGIGAIIGETPQMLGMRDTRGKTRIGKNNIIREYATIHASVDADKETSLGDDNFLMVFSHLGHDCKVGNGVVLCNAVLLGGHVQIEDKVFISADVAIQQFSRVGQLAMVGGLSRVNQDIPPFMLVVGASRVWGINLVGLRRAGLDKQEIAQIRSAYNILYRRGLLLKSALNELEKIDSDKVKEMCVFILASRRGICGPKRSSFWEKLFLDYPYLVRSKIPTYKFFLKSKRNTQAFKRC